MSVKKLSSEWSINIYNASTKSMRWFCYRNYSDLLNFKVFYYRNKVNLRVKPYRSKIISFSYLFI